MRKQFYSVPVSGGSLNTLAQNGTKNIIADPQKPAIIIEGQGSELGNDKTLKMRAKRKTISQSLALKQIDIENREGNPVNMELE